MSEPVQQQEQGSDQEAKTRRTAWIAVILMIIGFTLVALSLPLGSIRVVLIPVGVVLGLAGVATAKVANVMGQVD